MNQGYKDYSKPIQNQLSKVSYRKKLAQGFTLLEIIVVVAVLGVLFAIGGFYSVRYRDISSLREAQLQLAKDFERARSYSKRYSYDYKITIDLSSNKYDIAPKGGATGYPEIHSKPVNNVKFTSLLLNGSSSTADVVYSAPLGRLDSKNVSIQIGFISGSSIKTKIDLIGVTGLVITRGIQ
jgi:prepilin-type N-terminal cleavage/methylation domain-containing protein